MSSNIKVHRICEHCNTEFIARTTTTRFCSDKCAKRAYKQRIKEAKIEKSNNETFKIKHKDLEAIKHKEFLSVKEASTLLGCSTKTIYRLIESGTLNASNLSERMTRILKSDIDNILNPSRKAEAGEDKSLFGWQLNQCYTIGEAQKVFGISEKALYEIMKRNNVPKKKSGRNTYIPKEIIEKILR